jgi:hypothetical protein
MKEEDIEEQWHELKFAVQRSILYHNYRRRFFDTLRVWSDFLVIITGGAVIWVSHPGGETNSWLISSLGALVSIVVAFNLVVGYSSKAREHHDLVRRFAQLERDMVTAENSVDNSKAENLASFINQRLLIEEEEPPTLRVLDVYCHNELAKALGYSEKWRVKIGGFQSFIKQLWDYGADKLEREKEKLEQQRVAQTSM